MKKYFKLLLFLILFISTPVFASSKDLFRADKDVVVNEELNGSSFVAGYTVDIDSKVNGMLFAAGNKVDVDGSSDYLFAAGSNVRIDGASFMDGFIAGNFINLVSGTVNRDLYVAGEVIEINSDIERNAYIAGSTVKINGNINGNAKIYAENIEISDSAKINGILTYSKDSKVNISKSANINKVNIVKGLTKKDKTDIVITKIYNAFISIVNMYLIGVLILVFGTKIISKIESMTKDEFISNLGYGLITFVLVPMLSFILAITMIGLGAAVIAFILYLVLAYLSTIFSGYYISNLLLKNKISNKYVLLLIGIVGIKLLKLIPVLGSIVGILSLCLGLGIIIRILFNRK
ncbi:MAG: hypothetical protein IIZ40_04775 [Bacilli bacterium]|nr:hypothetical protein [Bacilli bacterium]